jgi:hypothetical protein
LKTKTIHISLERSEIASETRGKLDVLRSCLRGIRFLLRQIERPWKERGLPRLIEKAQYQKLTLRKARKNLPSTCNYVECGEPLDRRG